MLSRDSALIWTERMLAALERGNDQRKWHTLVDKVFSPKTLEVALHAVVANAGAPGIDGITTWAVAQNAEKSQQKFKETLRAKTKRNSGRALSAIIAEVNQTVRGWGNYFRGGVHNVPAKLEKWIRMRLRSILRKRDKYKGRGRGLDHHRYPNAWFADRGLISLPAITHAERLLVPSK